MKRNFFLFGNIESSGICGKEVQVGSYKQISRVVLRELYWKPLFYKLIHVLCLHIIAVACRLFHNFCLQSLECAGFLRFCAPTHVTSKVVI